MKSHIQVLAFFLTVCILMASTCKKDVLPELQDVDLNSPFEVPLNGKVIIDSEKIEIVVSEITDSRCADGVQCAWAGNAKVTLNASHQEQQDRQLSFCIGQCQTTYQKTDTLQVEYETGLYNLILIKVKPSPGTDQVIKSAVFILEKR